MSLFFDRKSLYFQIWMIYWSPQWHHSCPTDGGRKVTRFLLFVTSAWMSPCAASQMRHYWIGIIQYSWNFLKFNFVTHFSGVFLFRTLRLSNNKIQQLIFLCFWSFLVLRNKNLFCFLKVLCNFFSEESCEYGKYKICFCVCNFCVSVYRRDLFSSLEQVFL